MQICDNVAFQNSSAVTGFIPSEDDVPFPFLSLETAQSHPKKSYN